MREAIGNAFLVNFIIVILVAVMFLLISSISYTKSFRVRNRLIDIIEKNECFSNDTSECTSKDEIDSILLEIGYRVADKQKCKAVDSSESEYKTLLTDSSTNFRYCVYKVKTSNDNYYYSVVAYGYFEIPLIGGYFEIPVKGDTKIFYKGLSY